MLFRYLAALYSYSQRIWKRIRMLLLRPAFLQYGKNFVFDPDGVYSFSHIRVGDNVNLGYRPHLVAARSHIVIGSNVMFGPEVTIRGGNHRTDLVGRFMVSVKDDEKRPEDDRGVIIEDDVWVGTRAIILHGVTIGRGTVVAAGAIVTKSIPPYAIVAGVPARVISFRFDLETILLHELKLYTPTERLKRDVLDKNFSDYQLP